MGYCPMCGSKLFPVDTKYMEQHGCCSYCVTYREKVKYNIGDILMVKGLKYGKAEVMSIYSVQKKVKYVCRIMASGEEKVFTQDQLETVYAHDMRQLAVWKEMKK